MPPNAAGEVYLINAHISQYEGAGAFNHDPMRPRKLLLHKREIRKLLGALRRGGVTLVPLTLYFNARGIAKLSLAMASGKTPIRQARRREGTRLEAPERTAGSRPGIAPSISRASSKSARIAANTSANIAGVRRPVLVLRREQ